MIQNTKGNLNMKFMRENSASVLTVLFLVIVGILLLVNPVTFGIVIIKIAFLTGNCRHDDRKD